jgi:tRNA(Ser,Leu) C12 N-acetylase TAN1
MKNWNMIVTAVPEPGRQRRLLQTLNRLGEFHPCEFRDVCLGQVEDTAQFLEVILKASQADESWVKNLSRAVPIERTFHFTPESLTEQLKEAVTPFLQCMADGTFHVRLERRGLTGQVMSQQVERDVADHLHALARSQGRQLHTSFENPDYIVAAETIGYECGVTLLSQELRERYPFAHPR